MSNAVQGEGNQTAGSTSALDVIAPISSRNIVLIGFMGCGKTTVGRILAGRLGWDFLDTDALIVQSVGRSIPEIFAEEGEKAFRDHETEVLRSACTRGNRVISTGGGVVLRSDNVSILRENALVVWLTARAEVIVQRTKRDFSSRPLLAKGADDPLAHVLTLLGERGPHYQNAAHVIVDSSDRSPGALAAEVIRKWERQTR
jgi:shikimate kinase